MAKAATPPTEWRVDFATAAAGISIFTVAAGLTIGFVFGVASALLAFVTGALLGAILLVWHSLRTLAGDAEVDPAFEAAPAQAPSELDEQKRRALRSLKDIEQDHAVGKIDDADFAALDAEYRERAKDVIKEIDATLDPYRAKAEAMVQSHLEKRAAATKAEAEAAAAAPEETNACAECDTPNDTDATFCKKCGAKLTSES